MSGLGCRVMLTVGSLRLPALIATLVLVGVAVGLVDGARRRRARDEVRARCSTASVRQPATRVRTLGLLGDGWRTATIGIGSSVRRVGGRPPDLEASRRLGASMLLVAVGLGVGAGPVLTLVVAFSAWALPVVRRLTGRSRDRAAVVDELPEVVDLVRLGIGSGLNVRLALEAVARHHDGAIVTEVREVLTRVERGERLADALDTMAVASDAAAPLVDALVATERYGAPLVASLDRVAADARLERRRRREEAARRVPVKLLFPLVFCTLPAFALLTVVPVLLRSLPSLAP